ncbi:Transcription initiation protein spt3 [Coemansia sp. RSA 2610]|nr:Transcription initiation protein spt3 [Coemansia sp. RSA 2610]
MGEAVHSVIYASTRIDVKELPHIRDMLAVKYGKDMVKSAMANADGLVNQKLLKKLCLDPPSSTLVQLYLKEIAAAYSVPWAPDGDNDDEGSPSFGLQEPAVSPSAKAESAEPEEPSDARDADDTKETGEPKASGDTKATGKPAGADSSKSAEPAKEAEQESDSDAGQLPSPPTKPVAKAKSPSPVATKPIAASTKPAAKPASKSDDLAAGDGVPTMEELQRRFSALK